MVRQISGTLALTALFTSGIIGPDRMPGSENGPARKRKHLKPIHTLLLLLGVLCVSCSGSSSLNALPTPRSQPLAPSATPTNPPSPSDTPLATVAVAPTSSATPPPSPTQVPPTRTHTVTPTTAPTIPANTPTSLPVSTAPSAPDAVLVGAGDMRQCNQGLQQVAALINAIPGTVMMLGDATNTGAPSEYPCYDRAWGQFKDRTLPVIGNHEYETKGATGYFGYFGAAAHAPGGYYSVDLGSWHIIVLNSNCSQAGGCQSGSPQEQWLKADLAAHPNGCKLAMWHHPLFNSGKQGNTGAIRPLWQELNDAGVHLVLNGHEHNYERFARQNANGVADPKGIREFILGTGGAGGGSWVETQPNSEVHAVSVLGAMKLTLRATSYEWQFIPVPGTNFTDSGSESCQ